MDIDVVWVAVSVYMIVLVVYGSYLLRGWIRMRKEHRDAWKNYKINNAIEGELAQYSLCEQHIGEWDSFNDGILEGRKEFAEELWNLINKEDLKK